MTKRAYEFINDCVMGFLYSPRLFVAASLETRTAHRIRRNRARGGEDDDDVPEEWEQLAQELDFAAEGWTETCDAVKPNMDDDPAVLEVRKLRAEVDELRAMLAEIGQAVCTKPIARQKPEEGEETPGKQPAHKDDGRSKAAVSHPSERPEDPGASKSGSE